MRRRTRIKNKNTGGSWLWARTFDVKTSLTRLSRPATVMEAGTDDQCQSFHERHISSRRSSVATEHKDRRGWCDTCYKPGNVPANPVRGMILC